MGTLGVDTVGDMPRRGGQVVSDDTRMMELWDTVANAGADPALTGSRSSRQKYWRCPVASDHRWSAPPSSISRSLSIGMTGCPACAGRQLSTTNSFAARYPAGIALWHPTRNRELTPDAVLAGSPDPVWWQCPAGPDHEWQVSPLVLGSHSLAHDRRGCPFCAGKRASVTNSVASHPQLSLEWHPTANGDNRPEDVVASTSKKLWWRCKENPEHQWQASGANRTRGRGCPRCKTSLRSIQEVCLAFELQCFFPDLDLSIDKVEANGELRHVDVLLPAHRVVIEFDGRFRHAGEVEHERDARKTAALTAAGYRVLRVREEPLALVSDHDVGLHADATVKELTDRVLLRLLDLNWVPLPGLAAYLAEPEPRRVKQALQHLQRERPGRQVRLPGPATFTRPQRWDDAMAVLHAFVAREGHANVPFEHVENGFALGAWVGAKRAQHRRNRMAAPRAQELAALPGWTWDPVADRWEDGYTHLLAFLEREGHLNVPAHYWDEDGFPLGSWVRSHRRMGGRRTMTAAQQRRLEAVPGWSYELPTRTNWDTALAALESFAGRTGHCRLPRNHHEDGVDLDGWTKRQRASYHCGRLSPQRAARLEAVPGWTWNPQDAAWEQGFAALQEHVAVTGSIVVSKHSAPGEYPLGAWVGEQRNRYREGSLPEERRRRLQTVHGWSWDPHVDGWERHFAALEAFVDREGHARVPTDHVEAGLPLGSWVIRHRQDYKAGRVPADRVVRLQALSGWTWDVLAARWEAHFAALVAFAGREGHARVPYRQVEGGLKLGQWVVAQRHARRRGELAEARERTLAAVTGWVWEPRRTARG